MDTTISKAPLVPLMTSISQIKDSRMGKTASAPAGSLPEAKSAQVAVLGTVELLEHILDHLPARSLYKVREVCQLWHALVGTSPKILEKLFIRVKEKKSVWYTDYGPSEDGWSIAPSGSKVSNMVGSRYPHNSAAGGKLYVQPVRLNPLLRLKSSSTHHKPSSDRLRFGVAERVYLDVGKIDVQRFSPCHSWDGMPLSSQLTDPPTTHAIVVRGCFAEGLTVSGVYNASVRYVLRSASGVTLRDVISALGQPEKCSLWGPNIRWTKNEKFEKFIATARCKVSRWEVDSPGGVEIFLINSVVPSESEWESIAAGLNTATRRPGTGPVLT